MHQDRGDISSVLKRDLEGLDDQSAREYLDSFRSPLFVVFRHYSGQTDVSQRGDLSWEEIERMNAAMDFEECFSFFREFRIFPKFITKLDISKVQNCIIRGVVGEQLSGEKLDDIYETLGGVVEIA